jgi:hypothetical protein
MMSFKTMLGACALSLATLAGSAQAATVVNGSFERHPRVGNWAVFDTIPGWRTVDGNGIEIQTNRTLGQIDAQHGRSYVELDSHPNDGNSNSTMRQSIAFDVGRYLLSFYYSPRTHDAGSNGIAYSIGTDLMNLLSGSITGPGRDTAVGQWTRVTGLFDVTKAGTYNLDFAATGRAETYGGLIDNVAISPVPVPAGGVLLLTALGGLALARRRQRA